MRQAACWAAAAWVLLLAAPAIAERPAFVDLRRWQTPIRGQHGNNCYIYATVAALEAELKRAGHGDLDLSEAFSDYMGCLFFLETCAMDGRFRTRTMRVPGAREREISLAADLQSTIESATPCQRLGIPEEKYFPWDASAHRTDWPTDSTDPYWAGQYKISTYNLGEPRLPRSALNAPAYYGIRSVQWLSREDASRPEALEAALASGHEVIWDMKFGGDTSGDVWKFTVPPDPMGAGHRVLLVGYDRRDPKRRMFIAKNSWGPTSTAGAQGFTYLEYDFIRYGEWAHYITAITKPRAWPELRAVGRWELSFGDHRGTLDIYHLPGLMHQVFEDNDYRDENGQRVMDRRLGTFYENGDTARPIRVNGEVSENRLSLFVDFNQPAPRWDRLAGWNIELVGINGQWNRLKGDAWNPAREQFPAEASLADLRIEAQDADAAREMEMKAKQNE